MSVLSRNSNLAAYQSVAVHGGVAMDDPHRLVLMLMDGALQRLQSARGAIERKDIALKAQLLQRCGAIIAELRASLDTRLGGALAVNLDDLYEYMERQILRANLENRSESVDEIIGLLSEIRSAWVAIGPGSQQGAVRVTPR